MMQKEWENWGCYYHGLLYMTYKVGIDGKDKQKANGKISQKWK